MSCISFLASLIGLTVIECSNQSNTASSFDRLAANGYGQFDLPQPSVAHLNTQEWIDKLENRINEQGKVLQELYRLIDYQPLKEGEHYYDLEDDDPDVTKHHTCRFEQYWRVPTGVHRRPATGSVRFDYGIVFTLIHMSDPKELNRIEWRFDGVDFYVERAMGILRAQYWKPNRKRFVKWCREKLPSLGMTEAEIELYVSRQLIPVDHPTNDIVIRTPEEIEYFDKVVAKILEITRHMVEDSKNLCLISNGREPSDAFYNQELGTLSYRQSSVAVRC